MPKVKKESSNKEKHSCTQCGIYRSSPHNLRIHLLTNCSTEKRFVCEICDSKFLTAQSLKTHVSSLHYGDKSFSCQFCDNKYLSKGQLKVHERSHTKEKLFVCEVCKKGFSHRESLVTHSTIHSGIKPYICECCSCTFSCVGNLIKHRKVRPNSCGLPIYANKKVCKRAGVKCKGETPKTIVDFCGIPENQADETLKAEVIIYDPQEVEEQDIDPLQMTDHQYVSADNSQGSQDAQLTDFSKKEMDVFDYIGIEIKNIQEQERKQQLENEELVTEEIENIEVHEMTIEETEYYNTTEIIETEDSTFIVEQLEEVKVVDLEEEQLKQEQEFREYVDVSDPKSFHCKLCPKIYQNRNITTKHLKNEHNIYLMNYNYDDSNRSRKPQKDLSFRCQFCPKRYTSSRLVSTHEVLHGPDGDLLHKCSCCPLYFASFEERDEHQYAEHNERLICSVTDCSKKFDHPEKLANHVKYAHEKTKTPKNRTHYVCELCGRNFNTRTALCDHERSNCGKDPIYKCSYCEKNYHSAGSLKCHMSIHTNNLDFDCNFCDKSFRTKGQLTVHLRSHTKEKNFKCLHCPAEFSHRESLLTHNTLHTGIKRFECGGCGSRFSCISNLQAHRKSHKVRCWNSETKKVVDADSSVKMCRTESDSDK